MRGYFTPEEIKEYEKRLTPFQRTNLIIEKKVQDEWRGNRTIIPKKKCNNTIIPSNKPDKNNSFVYLGLITLAIIFGVGTLITLILTCIY